MSSLTTKSTSDHVLVDDPKVPLIMSSLTPKSTSDHVLVDAQNLMGEVLITNKAMTRPAAVPRSGAFLNC
ncbi:hypothetical protein TYRP_016915 [Tyrophagus putrescentiae]|nr:hypothetical protein TYRP_016915 [Tyrophagus putrescentiae]